MFEVDRSARDTEHGTDAFSLTHSRDNQMNQL
jgi:hypothetical protein